MAPLKLEVIANMATVLFIDSDAQLTSSLSGLLGEQDESYVFSKWAQAVSCLARKNIDLAVIGTEVSGFDCKQIVQMVRSSIKGKILVAGPEQASHSLARKYNADGYICKNQSRQEIRDSLSGYLNTQHRFQATQVVKPSLGILSPEDSWDDEKKKFSKLSQLLLENPSATTFAKLAQSSGTLSRDQFIKKHKHDCLLLVKDVDIANSGRFNTTRMFNPDQVAKKRHELKQSVIVPLDKKVITVGRSPSCDIKIRDNLISKFHAYIRRDAENKWTIQDSNSTNGTYISGRRISPNNSFSLNEKITIRFGELCSFRLISPQLAFINSKYHDKK